MNESIHNHDAPGMSELEVTMASFVPEGGNWTHIPGGLSNRVDQIRERSKTRGLIHTTYYGRLAWNAPAYTVNTYFSRMGNGCFLHPDQARLLSLREGARLQSFRDNVVFGGAKRSQYKQIGNAVPPLLARAVGRTLEPGTVADLFCGAGGMSLGFGDAGHEVVYAADNDRDACATYSSSHREIDAEQMDLGAPDAASAIADRLKSTGHTSVDTIVAGPPCQGFSTAGKRGATDPRSALLWVPFDVAKLVKPRHLIIENVQGILSMADRSIPGLIAEKFASLGMKSTHVVLRAERFGVPQRRTRVFFVGVMEHEADWNPPAPTHATVGAEELLLPPPLSVRDAIADLPVLEAGESDSHYDPPGPVSGFAKWCRLDVEHDVAGPGAEVALIA